MRTFGALAFVFGFAICSSAYADCLDEQRALHQLESATRDYAQRNAAAINYPFGPLNNSRSQCPVYGALIKLKTAKAAFIRHCYAELGLTQLQGEETAHNEERGARLLGIQCR